MPLSINRLLYGSEEIIARPIALRAGPLAMVLEGGKLAQVRVGDIEVWHGVSFTFRDPDWGTPEPVTTEIDVRDQGDAFRVRYQGFFPTDPVIELRVTIDGTREGRLRFCGEALPAGDILANRLGLCVLHPMDLAGANLEVEHADGRCSRSSFPTLIAPWPPFTLIRSIRHEYADGCWARCSLAGDVFELEDQRNNSDASFKTYSRSNLMPRPYRLQAGVAVRQSADLRLESPWVQPGAANRPTPASVSVGPETGVLPQIGIEISPHDALSDDATVAALRALRPSLLHLALDESSGAVKWEGIRALLAAVGAQLRLDVDCDAARSEPVLAALGATLGKLRLVPESVAVFPSEQACIDAARRSFPSSLVGGGTPHFFAQLNRLERLADVDFLSFTTSPIVHGAGDTAVMLSLQSLPSMIDTLRARHGTLPVRIGPSHIAVRRSPLGGQPASDGTRRVALAAQDPRCRGLFGAAWVLGYVAQFTATAADAVTLTSLGGPNGIVGRPDGQPLTRHPAYFVLGRLRAPARVCHVSISDPSRVAALALSRDGTNELLLANMTGDAVEIVLDGWPAASPISIMDAETWEAFATDGWAAGRRGDASPRFRLAPYAVASIERPA